MVIYQNLDYPKFQNNKMKLIKLLSQEYLINLMSNLLDIESLLKKGNNPINVFTENLINLS